MNPHAALIVALTVLLLAVAMALVGRARGKYGVKAPATSGHPDFERTFRAQMNTIEQSVMFLPVFLLAVEFGNSHLALWLGVAWLVGRVAYLVGYIAAAGKRSLGFLVATLALSALLVDALRGIALAILA